MNNPTKASEPQEAAPAKNRGSDLNAFIERMVDSLETHEGTMTDRERHLCETLLGGLAAAGYIPAAYPARRTP